MNRIKSEFRPMADGARLWSGIDQFDQEVNGSNPNSGSFLFLFFFLFFLLQKNILTTKRTNFNKDNIYKTQN